MSAPVERCVAAFTYCLGRAGSGAAAGLVLAVILLSVYAAVCLRTGLGVPVAIACGLLLGTLVLLPTIGVIMLGLALVRHLPLRLSALIIATSICVIATGKGFGYSTAISIGLGAPPILLLALAGAGTAILWRRRPGRAGTLHVVLGSFLLAVALVGAASLLYWLAAPGGDPFPEGTQPMGVGPAAPLAAPNPSEAGPYPVGTLCYGSGTDRRRPEYGPTVALKTDPVDASPFLVPSPKRFARWTRRRYWGFEPNCLPLNARVWFPRGEGLFPLVLIVHGNRQMDLPSEAGYAYLGELLASRGFIVASVDENFLNYHWSGSLGEEQGIRGWLLLKHLELWRRWNEQEKNPFYQRVDLANIALVGHSRGGEAILRAAEFNQLTHHPANAAVPLDFGFGIKTLIALAPTNDSYRPGRPSIPARDLNYLVLQGSHDGDVSSFVGTTPYRWIGFTGQEYRIKAALYIYRANHSQFNSVWGRYDHSPPLGYLLNRRPLLGPEDQRTIAKVYVSAFLEATLQDRQEYIPLFRDHRCGAPWLPETVYFSRFQDSEFRTLSDFDEPVEVTETTIPGGSQEGHGLAVWEQREMLARSGQPVGDHAVLLGWNTTGSSGGAPAQVPYYAIALPEVMPLGWWLDEQMTLSFCLADTGRRYRPRPEDHPGPMGNSGTCRPLGSPDGGDAGQDGTPIDLTVELVASDGRTARLPLSHCSPLPRALRVTFTKWTSWERARYRSPVEPVLQTFEMPLADFAQAAPGFDPALLKQIRFLFDRTKSAVILLDQVGITRLRPAPKAQS